MCTCACARVHWIRPLTIYEVTASVNRVHVAPALALNDASTRVVSATEQ